MSARPTKTIVVGLVAVITLAGCGETIDLADETGASTTEPGTDPVVTVAPLADGLTDDSPAAELLPAMLERWSGLSERVVDRDGDSESLAQIEGIWRLAEPQLRLERPEMLYGFEQAVELARTSVERRRPADADKGYRLAVDLVADYLSATI